MNVFVIHSYNGDTLDSFAPSIEKLCKENDIDYYFPKFPIRGEATYDSWENILNDYKEKGILNSESIVVAHSLGTQFIPKYLVNNNVKINTYISVAGFVGYTGREDLEKILQRFQPTDEEYNKCRTLVDNIYSIYSDNDELNSTFKLEKYAEKLSANKIFIKGAGHFNPKSNVKEIKEINNIILENIDLIK